MKKTNSELGRTLQTGPAEAVAAYTESESYDRYLAPQDIRGSQAHARMLARQGVISREDADTLVKGLDQVAREIGRAPLSGSPNSRTCT